MKCCAKSMTHAKLCDFGEQSRRNKRFVQTWLKMLRTTLGYWGSHADTVAEVSESMRWYAKIQLQTNSRFGAAQSFRPFTANMRGKQIDFSNKSAVHGTKEMENHMCFKVFSLSRQHVSGDRIFSKLSGWDHTEQTTPTSDARSCKK